MKDLKTRITENGIDYVLVGDYYIPDLKLPEEKRSIGKWGRARSAGVKRDTFPASLHGQQCQPDCQKSERGRRNRRDGHSRREQKTGADARTDGAAFGKAERTELKRGRSAETPAASPAFFS